jgi:hypothetical protein
MPGTGRYSGKNPKVGIPEVILSILIIIGVLECWSNGERADIYFINIPILHQSITPI